MKVQCLSWLLWYNLGRSSWGLVASLQPGEGRNLVHYLALASTGGDGSTILSVAFGWTGVAIFWEVFVLLGCPFPDSLTRQNKLLWGVVYTCKYSGWLPSSFPSLRQMKQKNPRKSPLCSCVLRSLARLPSSLHLSESIFACFIYDALCFCYTWWNRRNYVYCIILDAEILPTCILIPAPFPATLAAWHRYEYILDNDT